MKLVAEFGIHRHVSNVAHLAFEEPLVSRIRFCGVPLCFGRPDSVLVMV